MRPDRAKKIRNFYPWVYSDEVVDVSGDISNGDVVDIRVPEDEWVGLGFCNPQSHIVARILTLDPSETINREFFEKRLRDAASRRIGIKHTNAVRLVHGEADQLPGLVIDRYAETLVIQFRNAGIERFRKEIIQVCKHLFKPTCIYERSDTQAREEEGLAAEAGVLFGSLPDNIVIAENDVEFVVDPERGQKTGFYLDQRDNRRLVGSLVDTNSRLLDVYCYTGGFSIHAAHRGSRCLAVDKDPDALAGLEKNALRNGLAERIGARWGDAEQVLEDLRSEGRSFTHIVLDPPTLARHKNEVPPAKQLLTRVSIGAMRLLEPNGIFFISSCAYNISVNDLIEITRIAASVLQRRLYVIDVTYQPPDHPWLLQIPESLYLKSLILRVE